MAPPLVVVARLVAASGSEALVERELRGLVAPSRAEEGCLRYDLHRALDDPRAFVFVEAWESEEHLARHQRSPHVRGYRERVGERLASVDVQCLEELR